MAGCCRVGTRHTGSRLVGLVAGLGFALAAYASPPANQAATPATSAAAPTDVQPIRPDVPRVSQQALLARMDQARKAAPLVILDVRTPAEFAAGHIPGARNIPHDQLAQRIAELDGARSSDIVVYCRTGRRSGTALHTLKAAGFTRLEHLDGDYTAWQAAKQPIAAASETAPPAEPTNKIADPAPR
jgi:phage shock protein E